MLFGTGHLFVNWTPCDPVPQQLVDKIYSVAKQQAACFWRHRSWICSLE